MHILGAHLTEIVPINLIDTLKLARLTRAVVSILDVQPASIVVVRGVVKLANDNGAKLS